MLANNSDPVPQNVPPADWYASPAGRALREQEQAVLEGFLPGLFGYHLLAMGLNSPAESLAVSPIRHRIAVAAASTGDGSQVVRAHRASLPFRNDSVDVVLLAHQLEYHTQPHALLREADRVLRPEGHLLIVGFNPLSLNGLVRLLPRLRRRMPWNGHFYRVSRLRDWLQLLGFEVIQSAHCGFVPPLAMLRRLDFIERIGSRHLPFFSGVYVLLARKNVITPNVIRPRWRREPAVIKAGVAEPTSRVRRNS